LRERVIGLAAEATDSRTLREAELARDLGVSRTPVREALNRLHQEGLVSVVPRRGAHLVPSSMSEYLSWLEVREDIEGMAARFAAPLIKPAAIAAMRNLFTPFDDDAAFATADDLNGYSAANALFHAMLVEESQNALLVRLSRTYDHMAHARRRITARLGRAAVSRREHDKIIAALASGDSVAAERAARTHIAALRDAVRAGLSELDP
jgi:DNA-binding GntR family transcriptional regulator